MVDQQSQKKSPVIAILVILVIALAAAAAYFFYNGSTVEPLNLDLNEDGELSEEQIAAIIERVQMHMMVPADDEPLVATIINIDQLRAEQAFYQNADNGDILLIYGQTGKALIYSPEKDILVNVGPVQVDPAVAEQAAAQAAAQQQAAPADDEAQTQ